MIDPAAPAQLRLGAAMWQPPEPSDELGLRVLRILQDGRTHDRVVLADRLDTNVRAIRAAVSELRQLGWPVGYGADHGYRLSWDDATLDALERKYHSQALSQLRTLNRIRRARRARAAVLFEVPSAAALVREKIETDVREEEWPIRR